MKSGVFQDAVESSTKVFGRKDTVRVAFVGDQACTDGDTVYLPALPPGAEIHTEQADVIRGYRDHEAMHVRCTDTSTAALTELTRLSSDQDRAAIVQYCEDVRIENAGVQEYGGMRHTLTATNAAAADSLIETLTTMGEPTQVVTGLPNNVKFRIALSSIARSGIGVESDGKMEPLVDAIQKSNPALHALAKEWAQHMVNLPTGYANGKLNEKVSKQGTWESFKLSERIHQAFLDFEQQQQQVPPPPPPPEDGEEEDDGVGPDVNPGPSGKGKGNGKGKGQKGEESEDEDDQPCGGNQPDDEEDDDGDGKGGGKGGGGGDGEEDDDQPNGGGDDDDDDDGSSDGDGPNGEDDNGQGGGSGGGQPGGEDGGDQGGGGGGGGEGGNGQGKGDAKVGDSGSHVPQLPPEQLASIEKALEEMRKAALQTVVDDVSNSGIVGPDGKVIKSRLFRQYSNKFSQKLPAIDVYLANGGVKNPSQSVYNQYRTSGTEQLAMIERAVSGKRAMIRRLLELELQARSDRRWESGKTSGRLHSVRLVSAMQGVQNVYQRRESGKDMDTLLMISIDGSESMRDGGRMFHASSLAFALAEALERTGCDITVHVWSNLFVPQEYNRASKYSVKEYNTARNALGADNLGRIGYNSRGDGTVRNPESFTSMGVLTRAVVKEKRQRINDAEVRASFGLATNELTSSTPTFQAVFDDLRDLALEQHSKKIYLHLTDGAPDRLPGAFDAKDLMDEAHAVAASIGVHMIGVGIAGNRVGRLFKDSVEVSGPDAYEPVMKKLAKLIAKESGHAAGFKRAA